MLCLLGGGGAYAYHRWERQQALKPAPLPKNAVVIQAPSPVPATSSPAPTAAAPTPVPTAPTGVQVLSAPYTGQAPSGNWDSFHEETCEAAAVLTVGYWYANKYVGSEVQTIPPAEADQKLHQIVAWERAQFKGLDLPLTSVAQVGANFYNLDSQVLPIPADNPEAIRQQIAARHPVIIPVMTQLLNGQNLHVATSPDTVMVISQNSQLRTHGPSRTEIVQQPKEEQTKENKGEAKKPEAQAAPSPSAPAAALPTP